MSPVAGWYDRGSILYQNCKREPSRRSRTSLCLHQGFGALRSGRRGSQDDTPSMGKSDKKVRAESINKLRKQYDAFLEEDRKRKERNEDIISKLDKMRSTVTRYKSNIYNDQRSTTTPFSETPTNIIRYAPQIPMQVDIRKHEDESYLLSQISKKYILIPRSKPIIVEDEYIPRAIKQDNNNDSDWKSKYSILDKLKQTEKEEASNASTVGNVKYDHLSRELLMSGNDDEQTDNIPVKDIKSKLADEYPPPSRDSQEYQDESMITQNYKHNRKEETPIAKEANVFDTNLPSKFNDAINLNLENGTTAVTNNVHQQLQSNSDNDLLSPSDTTFAVAKVYEQKEPSLHKNTGDYQQLGENYCKYEIEGTEKSHPDSKGDSNTEVIHPVEPMQETRDDTENRDNPYDMNYPIDVINVQDFTPNDNVSLVDGVNINPEGHEGNAAYYASSYQHAPETIAVEQDKNIAHQEEPVADTENAFPENTTAEDIYTEPTQQYVNSEEQDTGEVLYNEPQQYDTTTPVNTMENVLGIQAFETEQNELFYAEQPAYEQYNQGDAYNAGYTEGYDPAAYYENAGQEGYPVEINEHEETSQRYDPSYEQQYVTPVAGDAQYSEQAEYPQPTQNEQDVLVPTFMDYDPTQYNTEQEQLGITDQVEQQLDDEAGYYVQGAADNSNSSNTIQNVEESAPQHQTTDQTETPLENVVNVIPDQET